MDQNIDATLGRPTASTIARATCSGMGHGTTHLGGCCSTSHQEPANDHRITSMLNTIFCRLRAQTMLQIGCRISNTKLLSLSRTPGYATSVRDQRLDSLLEHARKKVPFYRDRIPVSTGETSSLGRLSHVPVLSKDDVEVNFPDAITDGSDSADWRMMSTRGTAQRLVTVQDLSLIHI